MSSAVGYSIGKHETVSCCCHEGRHLECMGLLEEEPDDTFICPGMVFFLDVGLDRVRCDCQCHFEVQYEQDER